MSFFLLFFLASGPWVAAQASAELDIEALIEMDSPEDKKTLIDKLKGNKNPDYTLEERAALKAIFSTQVDLGTYGNEVLSLLRARDKAGNRLFFTEKKEKKNACQLFLSAILSEDESILNEMLPLTQGEASFFSLDFQDKAGNTPLITAVIFSKKESVSILLKAGASLTLENNAGENALMALSHTTLSREEAVEALLLKAIQDKKLWPTLLAPRKKGSDTLLMRAIKNEHFAVVEAITAYASSLSEGKKKAIIDEKNSNQESALIVAIKNGRAGSVDRLLKAGASFSLSNVAEKKELMTFLNTTYLPAKERNRSSLAKLWIKAIEAREQWATLFSFTNNKDESLLIEALKNGHKELAEAMIGYANTKKEEKKKIIEAKDSADKGVLMLAAEKGNKKVVEAVIAYANTLDKSKKMALIDEKNKKGESSIMVAAKNKRGSVVKMLFEAGAALDVVSKEKDNFFMHLSSIRYQCENEEIKGMLEKVVKDNKWEKLLVPRQSDKRNFLMFEYIYQDHPEVVEKLFKAINKKKEILDAEDKEGKTPLYYAVAAFEDGQDNVAMQIKNIESLLDAGARIQTTEKNILLEAANKRNKKKVVACLLNKLSDEELAEFLSEGSTDSLYPLLYAAIEEADDTLFTRCLAALNTIKDKKKRSDIIDWKDKTNTTPLSLLCYHRPENLEQIKALLEAGADPNSKDEYDDTPFKCFMEEVGDDKKAIKGFKLFIQHKGDIKLKSKNILNMMGKVRKKSGSVWDIIQKMKKDKKKRFLDILAKNNIKQPKKGKKNPGDTKKKAGRKKNNKDAFLGRAWDFAKVHKKWGWAIGILLVVRLFVGKKKPQNLEALEEEVLFADDDDQWGAYDDSY